MMMALEQADHVDGQHTTLSMSMEMPRGTVHGRRLSQPEGGFLTLGLVIPGGLTAERQQRLQTLVAASV
jgi:hypothetical protein